jgi:2,4-dichlorophenol 6-monooxygenase
MASRKETTPLGAERREKLRAAIAYKVYEFDCHGVEMNHRYSSNAVIPDGTSAPTFKDDAELYHQATTWPGAHLPHVWLERDRKPLSTLDLTGKGRFTLITSIGGEAWVNAAIEVTAKSRVDIDTVTIGPGCDVEDPFGDWARTREIDDDGCLLVRPDMFICFRAKSTSKSANTDLAKAVSTIMGH